MAIPTTGSALSGRNSAVVLVEGSNTITLNCTGDVPIAPAMNEPNVEVTPFQGGDSVGVTVDGGYQPSQFTAEFVKADYDAIDAARADAKKWSVTLNGGTGSGFTGEAIASVSEGPTLIVNGTKVPTMTVTLTWLTTKAPSGN